MNSASRTAALALCIAASAGASPIATAQPLPTKAVRILVGAPTGGSSSEDVVAF
jgi:hypothetical protein